LIDRDEPALRVELENVFEVVLVLDCCPSGAFGKGIPKAPPDIELDERFEGSGRVTLAASARPTRSA
jgi:hypothetical protein